MKQPPGITQTLTIAVAALFAAGCRSGTEQRSGDVCCDTNKPAIALHENESPLYITAWLDPHARRTITDFTLEDQNGRSMRLSDLRGAPIALSFAYTRCQNQRKCPAVARSLGQLQRALRESPVHPRPWIALMTYDPEYDTPEILAQFAGTHGVSADARTLLLRPKPADRADLFHSLNVAVNYREGAVNLHGIQLILLDKEARPVRSYHSLMWNNAAVLSDLARLAAE